MTPEAMAAAVAEAIEVVTTPLVERIRDLESSVKALEARPKGLEYHGVWTDGETYEKGDAVTRAGSMWICCTKSTTAIPGTNEDWQLAVKRGRDGKDSR